MKHTRKNKLHRELLPLGWKIIEYKLFYYYLEMIHEDWHLELTINDDLYDDLERKYLRLTYALKLVNYDVHKIHFNWQTEEFQEYAMFEVDFTRPSVNLVLSKLEKKKMAFGNKDKTEEKHSTSVHAKIAEQLSELSPKVENAVVDALVERELTKRSEAVVQCMDMLAKCEGDLRKIKPDQVSYDGDGKEVSSTFSKNKFEEKKKLLERIEKLKNAITKAIEKGDFSDVYNLKNSGASGGSSKPEADQSSD